VPKYIYKFVSYLSQDSISGLPTRLNDRMYATYMCGDNNWTCFIKWGFWAERNVLRCLHLISIEGGLGKNASNKQKTGLELGVLNWSATGLGSNHLKPEKGMARANQKESDSKSLAQVGKFLCLGGAIFNLNASHLHVYQIICDKHSRYMHVNVWTVISRIMRLFCPLTREKDLPLGWAFSQFCAPQIFLFNGIFPLLVL